MRCEVTGDETVRSADKDKDRDRDRGTCFSICLLSFFLSLILFFLFFLSCIYTYSCAGRLGIQPRNSLKISIDGWIMWDYSLSLSLSFSMGPGGFFSGGLDRS